MRNAFEPVIGLEVHIELKTKTKLFCGCVTDFGAPPNTQCCPVCTGMPGALPVLNRRAVELAALAGLATHCCIASLTHFDRKNYFYPDLPKGYQITQQEKPLCENGYLMIDTPQGEKRIGIRRIHLEEDAGKLLHEPSGTLLDCNRCGIPLMEVVTEPDMRNADEATAFLRKLREIVLFAGISMPA
jgi:aspartyl-tRNA(Asn)/glutamyl-tRNA(Gln) amidotransferase subunit B